MGGRRRSLPALANSSLGDPPRGARPPPSNARPPSDARPPSGARHQPTDHRPLPDDLLPPAGGWPPAESASCRRPPRGDSPWSRSRSNPLLVASTRGAKARLWPAQPTFPSPPNLLTVREAPPHAPTHDNPRPDPRPDECKDRYG